MGNDSLDAELWFALSACLRVTGAGKEHEHMDTDPCMEQVLTQQ